MKAVRVLLVCTLGIGLLLAAGVHGQAKRCHWLAAHDAARYAVECR